MEHSSSAKISCSCTWIQCKTADGAASTISLLDLLAQSADLNHIERAWDLLRRIGFGDLLQNLHV